MRNMEKMNVKMNEDEEKKSFINVNYQRQIVLETGKSNCAKNCYRRIRNYAIDFIDNEV